MEVNKLIISTVREISPFLKLIQERNQHSTAVSFKVDIIFTEHQNFEVFLTLTPITFSLSPTDKQRILTTIREVFINANLLNESDQYIGEIADGTFLKLRILFD